MSAPRRTLALLLALASSVAVAQDIGGLFGTSRSSSSSGSTGGTADGGVAFSASDYQTPLSGSRYYVRTTGTDSASCGNLTSPCASVQGACDVIPKLINADTVIDVGSGSFSGGAICWGFSFSGRGDAGTLTVDGGGTPVNGSSLTIQCATTAYAPATGTASGTVTSATQGSGATFGTLTDSTQTWTVNDLRGQMLRLPGEVSAANLYREIVSNTATAVTIAGTFGTAPTAGQAYSIETTGTNFTGSVEGPTIGNQTTSANTAAALHLGAAPLTSTPNVGGPFRVRNCTFSGTGGAVRASGGTSIYASRVLNTQTFGVISSYLGEVAVFDTYMQPSASGNYLEFSNTSPSSIRLTRVHARGTGAGTFATSSGRLAVVSSQIENFATGFTFSSPSGLAGGNIIVNNSRFATISATCVAATSSSAPNTATSPIVLQGTVDFTACGTAVAVFGATVINTGTLTGSGNTTIFDVRLGGIANTRSVDTVTGTTGISLDGTTYTIAALRAASPKVISNLNYHSRIWEP